VLFITIEDETGTGNLVVWPSVFESHRRIVLTAGMIACRGRVQREGQVVHLVAENLTDLTGLLRNVSEKEIPVPLSPADHVRHGGADQRERAAAARRPRDIFTRDLRIKNGASNGIKVPTRDFR
jgi:error-prone DNA polymerase